MDNQYAKPNRLFLGLLAATCVGLGLIGIVVSSSFLQVRTANQERNASVEGVFSRLAEGLPDRSATTPYGSTKFGIYVQLPGVNWDPPGEWSKHNGEYVWRRDGNAHFSYSVHPSSISPSDWVQTRLEGTMLNNTDGQRTSEVVYKGFDAIKLETLVDYGDETGPLWKEIFYVFSANDVTYIVQAGTIADVWGKGGQELVTSILDSVSIAQQTIPPEAVPTLPIP